MTTQREYDAIIIGAGQSGGPLSSALAGAGWKTALVERKHVGGTCINEGCTPTKTMVASARAAYMARRSSDYGVHHGPVSVDMIKVRQRKRDIVESFRSSGRRRIENTEGLDFFMGEAAFTSPNTVNVRLNDGGETELKANYFFINTGARPRQPDLPGLGNIGALDSTSIMELDQVPEHLLVLGGGYVGLEFGQMFRRFGSRVSIVQRGEQLLVREDQDVAEEVKKILEEDGIEILLNSEARQVTRDDQNRIHLKVQTSDGERTLTGSHLLVAVGRVPNSEVLNLAVAGINTDKRGYIQVNERLETNREGFYALGDVKGGPAFTHISYDDYRIIRTNLLGDGDRTTNDRLIPYTVFIDPQLGRVGLSEQEARRKGLKFRVAKMPMDYVARALEVDEPRGFLKAIVDAESDQILGCAFLGIQGGELMGLVQVAMMGNLPYTALRDAVFTHPTLSESLNNLFAGIDAS